MLLKVPARKKRLSKVRQVENILNAARLLIIERGYENALIADIAERADVAEGTIYRYFENKRELLIKVAENWFSEQITADIDLSKIQGTQNKLQHILWHMLEVTRRAPALSRFVLTEFRPHPQYRNSPIFEVNRYLSNKVREVVREAVASGEFKDDVSEYLLRDMAFGCMEHHIWSFLRGEGDFDSGATAAGIATVICRGMTSNVTDAAPIAVIERLERATAQLEKIVKLKPLPDRHGTTPK